MTDQSNPAMTDAPSKAIERMDRARAILTDDKPRPDCNWGMLDTSDLRAALAAPAPRLTDERIVEIAVTTKQQAPKGVVAPLSEIAFARAIEAEVRRPAEPAPNIDEKAAQEFYACNPSAALFDLRKRLDGPAPDRVAMAEQIKELAESMMRESWSATGEEDVIRNRLHAAIDALATSAVPADASQGASATPTTLSAPALRASASIAGANARIRASGMASLLVEIRCHNMTRVADQDLLDRIDMAIADQEAAMSGVNQS